ncbi:MAG TPA: serine hydrolase domain-containing protein [Gemmatimonadaceae bacterium]|nr:serine hydrolase domain-containing protein [Gemmatimonadaceae bacterium]
MLKPSSLKLSAVVLAFLTTTSLASAQAQRTLAQKLDSLAGSGIIENRAVGIAAAVVKGNDTLLLKAYGKADVEWDVPLPVDAMFEIGSITKQFTATAVLQLRDAGKLSLDDDITKWLPDFDTRGNKVTLRRLLDHTSGIVGLTEIPEFGILAANGRFPRDSGYALIKRQAFQFPTGQAQIYNNSAFWLLGLVIEKASGGTYEDYIEKKIFEPLGMKRSTYCNSGENIPRRAHGYGVQNGVIRRAPTNVHTWPFAAGSLCSTVGDMVTWLKALHGGKVLSPKSYAEMIAPSKLSDGTLTRYGMGIAVGKNIGGLNYIGHGGSIAGFNAEATWYPDAKMAVVVLMNTNGNLDPGSIAAELAAEILPSKEPQPKKFTGDGAPLLGKYKGPSRGRDMVVEVTQTPEGVAFSANGSPPRVLPWVDGLTFRGGSALMTVRRASGNSGPMTELLFDAAGGYYYILKRQ